MAIVREIIGFDNNAAVMTLLQEQYKRRRDIDKELGIECRVSFFMAGIAGEMTGRMSIQYDWVSLAAMEDAWNKRNASSAWNDLNSVLSEAGFAPGFRGIMFETTPE